MVIVLAVNSTKGFTKTLRLRRKMCKVPICQISKNSCNSCQLKLPLTGFAPFGATPVFVIAYFFTSRF